MSNEKNQDIQDPGAGRIEVTNLLQEMEKAYLDYSMSVIVDRALPDVRDGLKPVHRRILYSMHGLNLRPDAKFRKSATIVGEVLGKYHPHGDVAVYDALVRMAQNFSMRYRLVNGQGNFGSMDGDSAAAMRYTEAKMMPITQEMLVDIEKDTVDFQDNYDGTQKEPTVLPARIPNLLVNGISGIAVGMATNIPPHNLREVVNATIHLIDTPDASTEDLLSYVKGPDFPTGGEVFRDANTEHVYASGRGPIVTRAQTEIVERTKNAYNIVVTEMTYQVNKANLVQKLANLVKDKKIEGIRDIRDESDKEGIRLVIELKSEAYPQKVLNRLYKTTELQKTFHVNTLALCEGIEPRTLGLKQVLTYYLEHRKQVITRKIQHELKKAREREHILEGLNKALDFIDRVIEIIRGSRTKEEAFHNLIEEFAFSEAQTRAILDMRLQTLAGLERERILNELRELQAFIEDLEQILADEEKILEVIKQDLVYVRDTYGDERRTYVHGEPAKEFDETDFIPDEETIVILTHQGYIKRMSPGTYRSQHRGGVGMSGIKTREADFVSTFLNTTAHSRMLFFTNTGRVLELRAYEIPQGSRGFKGHSIVNFLNLSSSEQVTCVITPDQEECKYITTLTKQGLIKKTPLSAFDNIRQGGIIALNLKEGDQLQAVGCVQENEDMLVYTREAQAIRFSEADARSMGRTAAGVKAIELSGEDEVLGMEMLPSDKEGWLVLMTEKGHGKRTAFTEYRRQKRGGSGIKMSKVTEKTGGVQSVRIAEEGESKLLAMSQNGNVIKVDLFSDVPELGRNTQGVRLMKLGSDDTVASITLTDETEDEEAEE
jgi:DNA gyrase subunit A